MSVMMVMRWNGVTPAQYDRVRAAVGWETAVPTGAVIHLASFDKDGANITDVWESAEDFQNFVEQRLMSEVREAGITGDPQVQLHPLHACFNPALDRAG